MSIAEALRASQIELRGSITQIIIAKTRVSQPRKRGRGMPRLFIQTTSNPTQRRGRLKLAGVNQKRYTVWSCLAPRDIESISGPTGCGTLFQRPALMMFCQRPAVKSKEREKWPTLKTINREPAIITRRGGFICESLIGCDGVCIQEIYPFICFSRKSVSCVRFWIISFVHTPTIGCSVEEA